MNDAERLLFVMKDIDGFVNVKKDKYEYALCVAQENGREEPNKQDELDGIRALIDMASVGFCAWNDAPCDSPATCRNERLCAVRRF